MKQTLFVICLFVYGIFYSQTLSTSLSACYALDGSAVDPINSLNGTLSAVSPTVNRYNVSNSAYHLTGSSSSYIQLPANPLLKPTNALSFSAWLRFDDMASHHYILYAGNGCSSYFEGYALTVENSGGGYRFALCKANGSCSSGSQAVLFGTATLSALIWYHVGFYMGNDSLKMYVNGVPDGAMPVTFGFNYSPLLNVYLGGTTIPAWNYPMRGSIDNVRFYTRKLSHPEFTSLYTTDPACNTIPPQNNATASFTVADTICVNQSFTPVNNSTGTISSYYWSACGSTLATSPQTTSTGSLAAFNGPVYMSLNKDAGNYYMFVTNNFSGNLTKLYYGSSLNNTPVVTNLGSLGNALPVNTEGIYIEKEGTNWYGLVVGSAPSSICRLDFGTSLASVPTATNWGNIGVLNYPHNIKFFRTGGNVYAYTINQQSNSLTLFSFGNSMANGPTGVNLGNPGNLLNSPSQISFFQSNNNWYAIVCNDLNNTLIRLDFGNSLLNVPTATSLGNPGGLLNGPRGISITADCNAIHGLVANRNTNTLMNMSFPTGATGPVVLSNLGNIANFSFPQTIERYRVGDTLSTYIINVNNNSISRLNYGTCHAIPTSTLQNPAPMLFPSAGLYTLSLVCNEGSMDQSTYCKTIQVLNSPTLNVISTSSVLCANSSASLSAFGAATYTWYPGVTNGSSLVVNPIASIIYTVIGTSGSCISSATIQINVSTNLILSASASANAICAGQSTTLSASNAQTYNWQPGNLNSAVVVVSPSASTIYTVNGINSFGCSGTATLAINVLQNPTLSAIANPTGICAGGSSTLSVNGASSYTWYPGNFSGNSFVVNPTGTTTYTVLGATGSCTSAAFVTLTNTLTPVISSSGNLCNNNMVSLFVSPNTAGNIILWSGPGISGPVNTASINVNAGGIYTVVINDPIANCSGSSTINVNGNSTPLSLNIVPSNTAACFPGPPINMLVSSSSALSWFPVNAVSPSTGPLVSVSPSVSSSYTVVGVLGSCSGTAVISISVNITPTVISSATYSVCLGKTATLSASGAIDYNWIPGNLAGATVTLTPGATTNYSVIGMNGTCTDATSVILTVFPSPVISPSISSGTICKGQTVTIQVEAASGYTWLPQASNNGSLVASPTVNTVYSVSVENSFACVSSTVIPISVIPVFSLNVSGNTGVLCNGQTQNLQVSGASSYTWYPGVLTGSLITVSPNISTVYTVVADNLRCSEANVPVTVVSCTSSVFGLTNAASLPELTNSNYYKIDFTVTAVNTSPDDLSQVDLVTDLNSTFIYPNTFTIVKMPTVISQASGLVMNPNFDGKSRDHLTLDALSKLYADKRDTICYSVMVDPHGFYGPLQNFVWGLAQPPLGLPLNDLSNDGFEWDPDKDGNPGNNNEVTIINIPLIELFIPGGFSPNGDGINDLFVISGLNGREVKLQVFNRWGTKVYEKDTYENNWDGKANAGGLITGHNKLPQGTYFYVLQFKDGNKNEVNGFIVLEY